VGRFGHIENLWAVLVGAVLVHGPFWYRPAATTSATQAQRYPAQNTRCNRDKVRL